MSGDRRVTPEYMRSWGKHTHGSPLYAHLVEVIATDDDLLRVINLISNEPPPNVLFAAVQYLLMEDPGAELASFYPNLVEPHRPLRGVGPIFREYVLDHEEEIVGLGTTRYAQTNECRRCVALLPGVMASGFGAFHLVDVGTSAGLNLALDRYRYSWSGLLWGPSSPVLLESESRGVAPELSHIEVLTRTGLDLHPVDPGDPDDRRWLVALIWPEHQERRARLQAALELVAELPMDSVRGDALETLGPTIDGLPEGEPVVVMNSFALNQFTQEQRLEVGEILAGTRAGRPIHRVSMEFTDPADQWVTIRVEDEEGWRDLGQAHPHGEWIELYARP